MSTLGQRIRSLRESKHINQKEFAEILHISISTLSQYESDTRVPSDETKIQIADYFNVSLDYLLGISENVDSENLTKNQDLDIALLMKNLYSLDNDTHLSKKQIEMIKALLLANKDFILSA